MARVFERPRYKHQARNKLISIAVAGKVMGDIRKLGNRLNIGDVSIYAASQDYDMLAELALDLDRNFDDLPGLDESLEQYLIDSRIGAAVNNAKLLSDLPSRSMTTDILNTFSHYSPEITLTDSDAVFWLVRQAMVDDRVVPHSSESHRAWEAAKTLTTWQCVGSKIAAGTLNSIFESRPSAARLNDAAARAELWVKASEDLEYRSQPIWVRYCRGAAMRLRARSTRESDMYDKINAAESHERYNCPGVSASIPDSKAYNYAGVIVIFVQNTALVLDAAAASNFRVCMTALRNCAVAMNSFRLTGDQSVPHLNLAYRRATMMIAEMIRDHRKAEFAARHMHLAYARWQNLVGEATSLVDCGAEERDIKLKEDMLAVHPATESWWNFVMGLDIPERIRAEFFKLYHLLPPPDIDALKLHRTFVAKANNANPCSPAAIGRFLSFCKAYDCARFLSKNHREPKYTEEEGYNAANQRWWKRCLSGKFSMPVPEDWGKVQISGEFSYDNSGDFHIFSAKDATRVVSKMSKYMDRAESRSLSSVDQNELLAALFRGPKLSNGEDMEVWRDRVMRDELTTKDECIAAEAGKSENTKPGDKTRETLSACDTVREFLTEVDQSMRPLAAMTPGVSIRVDLVKHKRKFQTMAAALTSSSERLAFASSTDISGWSPRMPRAIFHAWQEYALSTTECPCPAAAQRLWDRLRVFVDRRGIKEEAPLKEGNVQGWPATSDTTMHAHILIYWAYELKRRKILSEKELAYTLCLIDDAATVVALEGTLSGAKAKAEEARELLREMYAELGFEMDTVKSFFSAVKFVYLNELYWDGAQVAHATKTLMRVDKDHTRRFSSLPDKIAACQGVAASAVSQGADPVAAYLMSLWLGLRFAYQVCPQFSNLSHAQQFVIAYAPVGMNGLGIRTMVGIFATGANDPLTWYLETISPICMLDSSGDVSAAAAAIVNQEPSKPTARALFSNPFGYSVEMHRSVTRKCAQRFREAARDRKLAQPFADLEAMERDPNMNTAIEHVLSCGLFEAGLLEELAGCMPESFVDETLARIDKSELIATMLGPKGIRSLRRSVLSCDRNNLQSSVDLVLLARNDKSGFSAELTKKGSFAFAKEMRDKAHARAGFRVLNHTYPCPFGLWAFAGENLYDPGSESGQRATTVTFHPNRLYQTAGSKSKNMYDSRLNRIGYKGQRTISRSIEDEVRVALHNPVRRKVAAGLAALRWAEANGAHYAPLLSLFTYAWGGHFDSGLIDVKGRIASGSAKRLSLRHSKANHIILCYPNTQSAVRVNAEAVTRKHAGTHHMYDVFSAITALRTACLIEAGLRTTTGRGEFCYSFLYKANAAAVLEVPDKPSEAVEFDLIRAIKPFSRIDSPLAKAAAAVTSPGVMAQVANEYTKAGARAAEKLFADLVEDGTMGQDDHRLLEAVSEAVHYTRTADTYGEYERRRAQLFAAEAEKVARSGIVHSDVHKKRLAESSAVMTAAVPTHAQASMAGKAIASMSAREIAMRQPKLAHRIQAAGKTDDFEAVFESDDWEKGKNAVEIGSDTIRATLNTAEAIAGEGPLADKVAGVLLGMGMAGFRSSLQATGVGAEFVDRSVIEHTARSFTGRTDSRIGWMSELSKRLSTLRHRDSEEYSNVVMIGAEQGSRAVVEILKAQWKLASGRYAVRADEIMVTTKDAAAASELNCKSAFLNAAAGALRANGNLSQESLYEKIVDQFVHSCVNHLESATEGDPDAFDMDVLDNELDSVDSISGEVELAAKIRAIAQAANKHGGSMDPDSAGDAASTVATWVKADVGGAHRSVTIRPRALREVEVRPKTPLPAPSEPETESTAGFSSGSDASEVAAEDGPPREKTRLELLQERLAMLNTGEAELGESDDGEWVNVAARFQWLQDNGYITKEDAANRGLPNMLALYNEVSRSEEMWEMFMDQVGVSVDLKEASEIAAVVYPDKEWDDEGEEDDNEFVQT